MERTLVEVGQMVTKRRLELHLDAAELARAADVDPKTLASLEKGERWPRDKSRSRIEQALRWSPGSLSQVRAGESPTIVGLIRGQDSRVIRRFLSEAGSEQEELRLLRLASIVWDARDLVRASTGPLMTALTSILDEASELVVYAVAGYDSGPEDVENARWTIREVRAGNSIRRVGDLYVAEDMSADDPFLARAGLGSIPQFDDDENLTPNDAPPTQDDLDLAARTAPPNYRPGQSEQGEADGEGNQDLGNRL